MWQVERARRHDGDGTGEDRSRRGKMQTRVRAEQPKVDATGVPEAAAGVDQVQIFLGDEGVDQKSVTVRRLGLAAHFADGHALIKDRCGPLHGFERRSEFTAVIGLDCCFAEANPIKSDNSVY